MNGTRTPQRRHRRLRLHRAALVGIVLFAGACNFTVAGFDSAGAADAGMTPPGTTPPGTTPPGTTPPGTTPPGTTPSADLAVPADMATPRDLYMPMPDLLPLPDKVGDECAGNCGAGLTCMSWVSNGYCSEACDGSKNSCPAGSSCVDIGAGHGGAGTMYCLVNVNGGGNCMRQDLQCRDCSAQVCGPSTFCGGC